MFTQYQKTTARKIARENGFDVEFKSPDFDTVEATGIQEQCIIKGIGDAEWYEIDQEEDGTYSIFDSYHDFIAEMDKSASPVNFCKRLVEDYL